MQDDTTLSAEQHATTRDQQGSPEITPDVAVRTWGNTARYILIRACDPAGLTILGSLRFPPHPPPALNPPGPPEGQGQGQGQGQHHVAGCATTRQPGPGTDRTVHADAVVLSAAAASCRSLEDACTHLGKAEDWTR
jgi:hypothetical protein